MKTDPKKTKAPKRRSAEAAKAAAAARSAEIREKLKNSRAAMPGSLIGAEPGWRYAVIPGDCTAQTRDMARKNFKARGYELVDDGHVEVAGHVDPEVWRIPADIHRELLLESNK